MEPCKLKESQATAPRMKAIKLSLSQSKCNSNDVGKQMNPLFFTFTIMGLHFHKGFVLFCYQLNRSEASWSIYSTILVLLIVTNVSRWLGVFNVPRESLQLIFDIQTSVWAIQCLTHYLVFFVDSVKFSHFRTFLNSYQEYIDEYRMGVTPIKDTSYRYVAIYWAVVSLFVALNICFGVLYSSGSDQYMWPFDTNYEYIMVVHVMNVIVMNYLIAMWLVIPLITCVFCSCFVREYKIINREIEKSSEDLEYCSEQLEHFRRQHFEVCKLIKRFDKFFSLHLAGDVACSLGIYCLLLYGLLWNGTLKNKGEVTAMISLFVCMPFGKVLLHFLFAGLLNEAVSDRSVDNNDCNAKIKDNQMTGR